MNGRTLPGSCTLLLVLAGSAIASEHVPEWADEKLLAPWYAAFNSRDAEAIADLYTPDGQVGSAKGRAEIVALFESFWQDSNITCSGGYDGFEIVADTAVAWGIDSCEISPASGGGAEIVRSRWLAVYEMQDDGTWLCTRDNSETIDD